MSTNEEFLNSFSVRIFDSEVDVESKAAFDIATDLPVGIAGKGVFEVIFHHLPEFFTCDVTNGDGWIVGDDVPQVIHGDIAGGNGSAIAPTVGEA